MSALDPPADPAPPTAADPPGSRPLPVLSWRDRLAAVAAAAGERPLVAVGVVVAVVVVGVLLVPLARSVASEPTTEPVEASPPLAGAATPRTTTGVGAVPVPTPAGSAVDDGALVVHAAGAVVSPGVYELPAGSRVDDLVHAAGGLAGDADGDRVNLALPLVDGARAYVPHVGEEVLPEAPAPDVGAGAGGDGAAPARVDVNVADLAELEQLPGVGPVTAQAIVDHREQVGPFGAVEDLLDVSGIGEARLEQLRDLVAV